MRTRVLFFLLCLSLIGCFSTPESGRPLPTAAPESVGMSSERLSRIHSTVQDYVDRGQLVGATTAVARHGKLVHFETYGHQNRESGIPMDDDSIFRIYSMSKPITSVAVLMLYEEGYFQLSDPVSRYLPVFESMSVYDAGAPDGSDRVPLNRPVSVRDLLTHTSGLTYGFFSDTPVDRMYREAGLFNNDQTLDDMVRTLGTLPLLFQPGTQWNYGLSTDVLGRLVEVVSGQGFDVFLRNRIFEPLNMVDTAFEVPPEKLERITVHYTLDEDINELAPTDSGATSTFAAPVQFFSGGGGLVSTPADYLRFAQMLLNGGELDGTRLLGSKTVELMTMSHLDYERAPGWGFGLGVQVCSNVAHTETLGSTGAYGWSGIANTYFFIDPAEDLIAMVWTQMQPYGYYPLSQEFNVAVYQAIVD